MTIRTATDRLPDLDSQPKIAQLVRDFYRKVAMDDLLGPVFADAHVDWPSHISKLVDFWSKQLLGERGYEGTPLRAHAPIHQRAPFAAAHYRRWLDLFAETVDQHFAGPGAELAKARAVRMARALQRLLSLTRQGAVPCGSPSAAGSSIPQPMSGRSRSAATYDTEGLDSPERLRSTR